MASQRHSYTLSTIPKIYNNKATNSYSIFCKINNELVMYHGTIYPSLDFVIKHYCKRKMVTCVWLIPKFAANSARSGRARYWVLWNRLSRCWVCSDEYIDLGFRIFLPLPLTRVVISPFSIEYVAPDTADVSTALS